MNDFISRQAAIEAIDKGAWGKEWDKALAMKILEDLPPAEPEIIMCKDCRNWDDSPSCTAYPEYHECHALGMHTISTGDGFCSRAERREDADDHIHI